MLSDLFAALDAREDYLRHRVDSGEKDEPLSKEEPPPRSESSGAYSHLLERHDPQNLRHLHKEERT